MARLSIGGRVKVINPKSPRYGQYGSIIDFQHNDIDFAERISDSTLETEMVEVDPVARFDWDTEVIDTAEEPPGK
jgi:hypothetical protein